MSIQLIIFAAIALTLLLWGMAVYNRIIVLKNELKNAYGQIDVQLKRRYDLIPNLVETAKKYLSHERETLEAVIAARSRAHSASEKLQHTPADGKAIKDLNQAEAMLHGSLGRLLALRESYPELKADRTIAELNEELTSTENRIGFARQAYNDAILAYNIAAEQFPDILLAKLLGFVSLPMLQATESAEERKAPKVQF
ncbi:MAG: LemA family protein [Brachymonas sp.]